MAITDEQLRTLTGLRITITGILDNETRHLVAAWARAWDSITSEAAGAVQAVLELDRAPTLIEVARIERASRALEAAQTAILDLNSRAAVRITDATGRIVDASKIAEAAQIAAQYPGTDTQLVTRFDRINPAALNNIVERTTQRVTSLTWPLSDAAAEAMLKALSSAVSLDRTAPVWDALPWTLGWSPSPSATIPIPSFLGDTSNKAAALIMHPAVTLYMTMATTPADELVAASTGQVFEWPTDQPWPATLPGTPA